MALAYEQFSRTLGLSQPDPHSAKYNPVQLTVRVFLDQPENRAAATDFDIIGMGAEAQNCWPVGAAVRQF
jgi:hypothetical protein